MSKYTNPLFRNRDKSQLVSESASSSQALDVLDPNICPKCNTPTISVSVADGYPAKYCDGCRVTMPTQE